MNDKKYKDFGGVPRTLYFMMKCEPDWVMSRFRHMEAELARLQAIVDGQPKTEDGIAPVIGQPLWALASDGDIIDGPMEGFDHFKGEIWFIIGRGPNRDYVAKRCNTYSIEALAAEAASK